MNPEVPKPPLQLEKNDSAGSGMESHQTLAPSAQGPMSDHPVADPSSTASLTQQPSTVKVPGNESHINLLQASAPFGTAASLTSKPSSASLDKSDEQTHHDHGRRTISLRPSLASLPESIEPDIGSHLSPIQSAASPTVNAKPSSPAKTVSSGLPPPSQPTRRYGGREKLKKFIGSLKNFYRIFTYSTWHDRMVLSFSTVSAIGAGVAFPIMTIIFGQLIGRIASVQGNWSTSTTRAEYQRIINEYVLYLVYLFVARFILGYICTLGFMMQGFRVSSALRLSYFKALLDLPVSLLDTQPPGQVAAIITSTSNIVQIGISGKLATVLQSFSMISAALIISFLHSWKLSLVTSSGLVLITICYCITIPFLVKNTKQVEEANMQASAVASEGFSSIRMIAACGAETKVGRRHQYWVEEAKKRGYKLSKIIASQQATIYFSVYSTFALAFWFAVRLLLDHEIQNVGTAITILMCVLMIATGVGNLAAPISATARAAGAAAILFNGIDAPKQTTSGAKYPEVSATGDIVLWNVNFTYPMRPNVKVLDNLCLIIPAGKVTAIVGPSGSGKSTIVALLERWYNMPTDQDEVAMRQMIAYFRNGTVTVGGRNIYEFDLKWWRTQLSCVQQEPFLFNQTIFENVASGLVGTVWEHADTVKKRELVQSACQESYADEFIVKLPMGYDTVVGDAGIRMSGGQRQRLAIARAIIKQPKILILDEATSSIDVRGEKIVQAALDKVSQNHTTIMIAHRLATVKKADNIVVLAKGKVVQWGTHKSMLAAPGSPYWLLTQSQELMGEVQNDDLSEPTNEDERVVELMTLDKHNSHQTMDNVIKTDDATRKVLGPFRSFVALLLEQQSKWYWYMLMICGAIIAGATPPVQAYVFANLIASFAFWGDVLTEIVDFWSLMFVVLAIAAAISYFCLGYASTKMSFHIFSSYRIEYFNNIIAKRVAWFDGPGREIGTLTGVVATDPTQLQQLLGTNLTFAIISVLSVLGCLVISFYFGWKLALVASSSAMPLSLGAGFFRIRVEKGFDVLNLQVFAESAKFATETIGAIRTVTALTLEEDLSQRYEKSLRHHVNDAFRRARFTTLVFSASDSLPLLAMALVLWYGGTLLISGEYTTFNYLVVYIAVIQGAMGAGQWLSFAPNFAQSSMAAKRIREMRIPDKGQCTGIILSHILDKDNEGVRVELRDVCFKYPTRDVLILDRLSLTVEKGQFAAIVGPSGSGKTSVISLLERFYDVTSGQITLNGIAIDQFSLSEYRAGISLVAQEPSLFDGTIQENILLGVDPETVTEDCLHSICRDAGIHDFIKSLPDGYNTKAGLKGVLLSGGQKQRINIARALIRNPRLLLLDEATSNLDSETEKQVQEVLERTKSNRTMIVIAHRLATVQNADVIFVLGDGHVLEKGTHEELLQKRGVYSSMCQAQALDR
ncbi:ABC transporter-like protein [Xylariaceae sp. FL1019]|nr:ABC transporter-like protein [Xylariaceae sp. FL1019]